MKYRKLLALAIIGSFSLSYLSNIVYAEDVSENYVEEVCTQENGDTAESATDNNVYLNLEEDEQSKTIDATNDEISEDVSNNDEEIISEDTNDIENVTNELIELDETDEVETVNDDEEHEHHYIYEKYNKHYHKKVCEDGDYEKLEKCVDENHDNVCELCGNDIEDVSTINSSINIEVKHFSDQTATIEYEDKTYEIELEGDYYTSDVTNLTTSARCNFEYFIAAAHDLENEDFCLYTGNINYGLFNDLVGIEDLYSELSEYGDIPTDISIVIFEKNGEIQDYTIEMEDNYVPSDNSKDDEIVEYEHDYNIKKDGSEEITREFSDIETTEDNLEDTVETENTLENFENIVDDIQFDVPIETDSNDNEQESKSNNDIKIDEASVPESTENEENVEE